MFRGEDGDIETPHKLFQNIWYFFYNIASVFVSLS